MNAKSFMRAALLVGALILAGAVVARCTAVTGTIKVNGTPFTGYMTYQLSYPGSTGTYINMPVASAPIYISDGTFAGFSVDGNDIQLPRGTYYAFSFYDPFGRMISRLNYVITGANYDLGAAVPTPVLTNNVNFLDLLGLRNVSITNLTVSNDLQLGSGIILSPAGVQNAESIMGILYAQAYNIQNPTSTTCGIQEAINALPSTGGIVVAQPGQCNVPTTISISKPVILTGMGEGGYADSTSFSTFNSPTTLNDTGSGVLIQVSPAAASTVSGVRITNMSLTGAAGSSDLVSLGNGSSTTAYLRHVTLDHLVLQTGKGVGVSVVGNVANLHIHDTLITGNAGSGITLSAGAGYSVTGVNIGPKVTSSRNAADGLTINGAGVQDVQVSDFRATNNTGRGVNLTSVSTAATFSSHRSFFSSNTAGNILLAAGSGHTVSESTIASSAAHGIDVTMAGSAGVQNLSLKDNTFSPANTTYDVANTSSAWVTLYPQVTQSPVTSGTFHYVTSSTVASPLTRTCNSNGCYIQYNDGTIEAWGQTPSASTGTAASLSAAFPITFTGTTNMQITVAANGTPNGDSNPHPMTCHVTSYTTTGLVAVIALPVEVGGSGYGTLNGNYCSYHVFGY